MRKSRETYHPPRPLASGNFIRPGGQARDRATLATPGAPRPGFRAFPRRSKGIGCFFVNAAPETSQVKCRPWARRFAAFLLQAIRHSSSWILRIFFSLLILLAVLFAYLHLVGLPAYFTDRFLDRMAACGYFLQIERLTLEIDRGLVARNVRLFATAAAPEPFMEAEALTVIANPLPLLRHRPVTPVLSIVGGSLRATLGQGKFGARQGSRAIAVDGINLRFSASEREVLLREFSADFLNIHFRGRGAVYLSPRSRPAASNPLATAVQAVENAPGWVLQCVEQANEIKFNQSPSADFTFALYMAHPQANTVSFRLDNPAGGLVRGVAFDRFGLDVAWKDQQIHLPDVQIHKGNGVLGLSGWYDATNQMVSVHLLNTLPPDTFLDLFPPDIRTQAAAVVADYRFPLRLELQVGPAPLAAAAERFSGQLSFSDATVRDVPIESLNAMITREGPDLRIEKASVQLGSGPNASRLRIQDGTYNFASRQFRAHVDGTINPHVIKPLLTPGMQNIVNWFGVEEPLAGDVIVGGTAGNPAIYCFGPVKAPRFTLFGVAVDSLQGQLDITNEVMHITGATLSRPEGVARGEVHMAFSNQTLRLDVDSTLDPRATTELLGPAIADFMKPFRLNGPARLQVDGLLDYCNFSLNQLNARVEAQRFGYDRWEAETAAFDLVATGRRLRFTNAVATAYGGQFAAQGSLYPVSADSTWRYEVEARASDARLTDLLSASLGKPMGELRGTVDGTAKIGGYIGRGTGPSVTGSGHVDVRGGLLFQTKLFSGLSAILSKILPDFTLFAQTDASGNYTIRNSRVSSKDIQLQGTVFSVKAAGDYSFGGGLDYRVEVQLLRGGPVAALVRLATLPVTRLLEFRLTGTFADPRWRPLNLNPAELFSGDPKPAAKPQGLAE